MGNRNLFLTVLGAGKSKVKMPATWSLVQACFLVHRGHLYTVSSRSRRSQHSHDFHKGTNLTHEGPTHMTSFNSTSQDPTPNVFGGNISLHGFGGGPKLLVCSHDFASNL